MSLKDLLFPKLCLGCQALGSYICLECQKKLLVITKDSCIYCKRPSYMGLTHPACKKKNGIDGSISFYQYNGFMQKIIKHIKYRLATDVFKELCQITQLEVQERLKFYKQLSVRGMIQPVPLYSAKLKSRGFNQALLFTEFFNSILELPVVDYLKRVKDTQPQAEMKQKRGRYLNIKGAFQPDKNAEILGKIVVIVDDVITTGSTILELTKALKRLGACKVYAISLAQG